MTIETSLRQFFAQTSSRIAFWDDAEGEFLEHIAALQLPDVTVVRRDELAALPLKVTLEREQPQTRFLIYAPQAAPPPDEDWLLDIRAYSISFRADFASMQLDELGLSHSQSLRAHLVARRRYLQSGERLARLKLWIEDNDDERALDRKMLACIARADTCEAFATLIALLHPLAETAAPLDSAPPAWKEIAACELEGAFWELMARTFGYEDAAPTLRKLLLRLFVSDFAAKCVRDKVPQALRNLLLPIGFWNSIAVCLNRWRDSAKHSASYNLLSGVVADEVKLRERLDDCTPEEISESFTFLAVDQHILAALRDRLKDTPAAEENDALQMLARSRRAGHWATSPSCALAPTVRAAYRALEAAGALLWQVRQYGDGFNFSDAASAYRAYENELFQLDTHYRHWIEHAKTVNAAGWDVLKALPETVEDAYGNGFLARFGVAWSALIEGGLLDSWRLEGVANQFNFYQSQVKRVLDGGAVKRVWVIVSDAFRYEAARELQTQLNGQYRFQADLSTQLGVLPSYTALGMASLLPHRTLSYGAGAAVLVDGAASAGMENRDKILRKVGGMAIGADELSTMKRDVGRELFRDRQVIFIYHNVVDSTGDKADSEDDTCSAVRAAIDELDALVRLIIDRFNGTHVLITADHGFLYQQTPPGQSERSALDLKPCGTLMAKKRYLLGHDLPQHPKTHRGSTQITARARQNDGDSSDGAMEFWVPRALNRFHFVGGAKYLHGGAMPQEIVIPVLRVREKQGAAAVATQVRTVGVQFVGNNFRVTTNRYRVQMIQTEAVSGRVRQLEAHIGIYEGDTPISTLIKILFDSTSDAMNNRMREVILELGDVVTDKRKSYALIVRDATDSKEILRAPVVIDLAFSADF